MFESQAIGTMHSVFAMVLLVLAVALAAKHLYRMLWSPLAKFPGPYFAACSRLFEAYHVLVKDDWLEVLEALHRRHGPVVRIGPNELHFSDHRFCLDFHKQGDLFKCDNYYGILSYLLGGLASSSLHRDRKSIIQPLFSGEALAEFSGSFMNSHIESLVDRLVALADGPVVNVTHVLWAYTTDMMVSYVLGIDSNYLKSNDLHAVHAATRAFNAIDLATILRSMWPLKMMLDMVPSLRRFSPLAWIDELISEHLTLFMNGTTKQESLAQTVLEKLWQQLPDERVVTHEMSQAIFIGNESLLSNLTVLLHHLIRNPECARKLRAELDGLDIGLFGHRVWRDPQIMRLEYLDAVCRESTRMSAPGWHRQPRQVSRPVQYEQYIIPPMTSLSFTLKLLEHDSTIHYEPQEFKPERWLGNSANANMARKSSVTFGTGTRTCLGQYLARHILRKTLAGLVYNFDMSFVDGEKDRMAGYNYLNTYPKRGREGHLMVKLKPRFRA